MATTILVMAIWLSACGGHSNPSGSGSNSPHSPVSSNPVVAQVDRDCSQVMPSVRDAVRTASANSLSPAMASQVVSAIQSLDSTTLDLVRANATTAIPAAEGSWHANLEELLAAFQYAAYGGGSSSPDPRVVQSSHSVSAYAAQSQMPNCRSDPTS